MIRVLAVGLAMAAAVPAGATLANGGFETGTLAGWTKIGRYSAGVVAYPTTHVDIYDPAGTITYDAVDGSHYAFIAADEGMVEQGLTRNVRLRAGQTLTGAAAFYTDDYGRFNDYGQVSISNGTPVTLFYADVAGTRLGGGTPWTSFSFTAPTTGLYTLRAVEFEDDDDLELTSRLLLDAVNVSAVPEPQSWALLGAGLAFCGMVLRRRRDVNAGLRTT